MVSTQCSFLRLQQLLGSVKTCHMPAEQKFEVPKNWTSSVGKKKLTPKSHMSGAFCSMKQLRTHTQGVSIRFEIGTKVSQRRRRLPLTVLCESVSGNQGRVAGKERQLSDTIGCRTPPLAGFWWNPCIYRLKIFRNGVNNVVVIMSQPRSQGLPLPVPESERERDPGKRCLLESGRWQNMT